MAEVWGDWGMAQQDSEALDYDRALLLLEMLARTGSASNSPRSPGAGGGNESDGAADAGARHRGSTDEDQTSEESSSIADSSSSAPSERRVPPLRVASAVSVAEAEAPAVGRLSPSASRRSRVAAAVGSVAAPVQK